MPFRCYFEQTHFYFNKQLAESSYAEDHNRPKEPCNQGCDINVSHKVDNAARRVMVVDNDVGKARVFKDTMF